MAGGGGGGVMWSWHNVILLVLNSHIPRHFFLAVDCSQVLRARAVAFRMAAACDKPGAVFCRCALQPFAGLCRILLRLHS
jgi:hypothetical protein